MAGEGSLGTSRKGVISGRVPQQDPRKRVEHQKDPILASKMLVQIFNQNSERLWKFLVVPVYVKRSSPTPSHYDYGSWKSLAVVNKAMQIAMCKYIIKKKGQDVLRLREVERDLRNELAQFWKHQWRRLQDVTEENRRLRYLPLEKEKEEKAENQLKQQLPDPKKTPIWAQKALSRDEARQTLSEIADFNPDVIGKVAKQELIHLKSAFAQFFTSWSRAAEIAPSVGQEEDFRKHIFSMANVPKNWGTKEWAKQAVYSMTEKQKHDKL